MQNGALALGRPYIALDLGHLQLEWAAAKNLYRQNEFITSQLRAYLEYTLH